MNFIYSFHLPWLLLLLGMGPTFLESKDLPLQTSLTFPIKDFQNHLQELKKGNEFFEAALYNQAIDYYSDLLEQSSDGPQSLALETRFHLAYTYFILENYDRAISILEKNLSIDPQSLSLSEEAIRQHSIYLTALSHKKLDHAVETKNSFNYYLNLTPRPAFYKEAIFELASLDFQAFELEKATQGCLSLDLDSTPSRLYILAQLHLAKIALKQENSEHAKIILNHLKSRIEKADPLFYEWQYLQGEVAFKARQYSLAINFFQQALPEKLPEKCIWYEDTLYYLGWCYLKSGEGELKKQSHYNQQFIDAEDTFKKLLKFNENEQNILALAQCYLTQASLLKQSEYYRKADQLLSQKNLCFSQEGSAQALLLRAEAASNYDLRNQFYQKLIQESIPSQKIHAKGWYMKGLNDFEQALANHEFPEAEDTFLEAAKCFRKAYDLLKNNELEQASAALKYQALTICNLKQENSFTQALHILDELMSANCWNYCLNQDEIWYIYGYLAGKQFEKENSEHYLSLAEHSLQKAASFTASAFGDQALHYLGSLYYQNQFYQKAEDVYLQLSKAYPHSDLTAEACLFAAYCADHLKKPLQISKERRHYTFEKFPNSPQAAEAYFTYYTYADYIQGDKPAIKHLEFFINHYSETPFLIDAHYLLGLDLKRDRKSKEGRWLRKKNLTEAIDAFQKVELIFDDFLKKRIPNDKIDYYTAMRYRASLERATINLAIAEEAQGAKRQIYLNYSEEAFQTLLKDIQSQKHLYIQKQFKENTFPLIEEENFFWLAQAYLKGNKIKEANLLLDEMQKRYQNSKPSKSYYEARVFEEQGKIALTEKNYQKALNLFKKAEEASKEKQLNTDQRLELWIAQSFCYRGLNQFDEALLILSKVINDDTVSALRLKAMYLRAETYEEQKRPELARKQLESMIKKGGDWAKKAQEKLDKENLNDEY